MSWSTSPGQGASSLPPCIRWAGSSMSPGLSGSHHPSFQSSQGAGLDPPELSFSGFPWQLPCPGPGLSSPGSQSAAWCLFSPTLVPQHPSLLLLPSPWAQIPSGPSLTSGTLLSASVLLAGTHTCASVSPSLGVFCLLRDSVFRALFSDLCSDASHSTLPHHPCPSLAPSLLLCPSSCGEGRTVADSL